MLDVYLMLRWNIFLGMAKKKTGTMKALKARTAPFFNRRLIAVLGVFYMYQPEFYHLPISAIGAGLFGLRSASLVILSEVYLPDGALDISCSLPF